MSVEYARGSVYRQACGASAAGRGCLAVSAGRLEVVGAALAGLADAEDELVDQASDHTADDGTDPVHLEKERKYYSTRKHKVLCL